MIDNGRMLETAPFLTAHVIESDRRKIARYDIALETQMCDREGRSFPARILNVSNGGLMAESDTPLHERDPVRIELPTVGWLRADIVWVLGNRFGMKFRDPIAPRTFAIFCNLFGYPDRSS